MLGLFTTIACDSAHSWMIQNTLGYKSTLVRVRLGAVRQQAMGMLTLIYVVIWPHWVTLGHTGLRKQSWNGYVTLMMVENYGDVTWASWRLKSPGTRLFAQDDNKGNTKAPHHFCEGNLVVITGFLLQTARNAGSVFVHVMTSSWNCNKMPGTEMTTSQAPTNYDVFRRGMKVTITRSQSSYEKNTVKMSENASLIARIQMASSYSVHLVE